jgi:hypothetical protein
MIRAVFYGDLTMILASQIAASEVGRTALWIAYSSRMFQLLRMLCDSESIDLRSAAAITGYTRAEMGLQSAAFHAMEIIEFDSNSARLSIGRRGREIVALAESLGERDKKAPPWEAPR